MTDLQMSISSILLKCFNSYAHGGMREGEKGKEREVTKVHIFRPFLVKILLRIDGIFNEIS